MISVDLSGDALGCGCCGPDYRPVQCQSKSGYGTMIGMSEYTSPSTPPKKYRTKTQTGSALGCRFAFNNTCAGGNVNVGGESGNIAWSGTFQWDALTGAATNLLLYSGYAPVSGAHACGDAADAFSYYAFDYLSDYDYGNPINTLTRVPPVNTLTPTSNRWDWDGSCHADGSKSNQVTGYCLFTLTDEDLPTDAMTRALSGLSWASSSCGADPCCNTSIIQSTFSVAFKMTQVRAALASLISGHTYKLTFRFARKPTGTGGGYIFSGDILEITFTATSTTETTSWHDMPIDPTYEYKSIDAILEDIT